MTQYFAAPRAFEGETAVCIASGPSLSDADVQYVREMKAAGKCRVFVCNNNYLKVPEADVLFFCDKNFWVWHALNPVFQAFKGEKITLSTEIGDPEIKVMQLGMTTGLSNLQSVLRTGGNSGYMQVNLAFLYGCRKVILLGYEFMTKVIQRDNGERSFLSHWFGEHPAQATESEHNCFYQSCLANFPTMIPDLVERGLSVINCSEPSAIDCFPKVPLREALK